MRTFFSKTFRFSVCRSALLLCIAASPLAQAEPTNFLYEACSACAPKDLAYSAGEFDQLHWVAAESGSKNAQPVNLSAQLLAQQLQQVQLQDNGKQVAWLDEDSAQSLAAGISAALARANNNQDAIFLITNRISSGFVSGKQGNSGRVFVDQNGLNILVGEAHVEFFGAYRATRMLRKFDFASRNKASKVQLSSAYLRAGRADWLTIPLQQANAASQVQPVPASVPVSAPVTSSLPVLAPAQAGAANAVAAPTAVAPVSPRAPHAATRDEKFYADQELRLKSLKRMREQNLISEEEYQAKRKEIVQAL